MGKRFTETGKWVDRWFRALSPSHKHGWNYLCDNCDQAGVIDLDRELADFQIGEPIAWDDLFEAANGRIEVLPTGKIWLTGFIEFQYGQLSEECSAHKPIFRLLAKYSLTQRVLEPIQKGSKPLKEKEKEKEKEEEKEKRFTPPDATEVAAYCTERKNGVDAQQFVDFYAAKNWMIGKNRMANWKAAVRTWEKNGTDARGSPSAAVRPEYRQVELRVFKAHGRQGDFLIGPKQDGTRVYGQLKSKAKIESSTEPGWKPA